ncbi:hypothetical protein CDAR_313741 [Caerostris darwini]|uniref:Uncharacterized protein n=1 Tax=Caerostris darwini TaxID=1538125 RepID=A0AAV4N1V5_9ARAC|nr:hypothetical protein CDAR_313741 [Caerostris darwini]
MFPYQLQSISLRGIIENEVTLGFGGGKGDGYNIPNKGKCVVEQVGNTLFAKMECRLPAVVTPTCVVRASPLPGTQGRWAFYWGQQTQWK